MVKRFLPWVMVLALASGASADEHAEDDSGDKPVRYVEIDAGWRARVPEKQRKLLDGLSDSKRNSLNELYEKLKNDPDKFDDILKHALTLEADQRTGSDSNPIRPSLYLHWALRHLSDENDKEGRQIFDPLLAENGGKGGITRMDVDKEYNLVKLSPEKALGKDVTATYITGRDSKLVEVGGKVFCLVPHPDKPFEWATIPVSGLVRPELARTNKAEFMRLNDLTGKIREAEETAGGLFLINDNKPALKAYNDPFRSPTPKKEGGVRITDAPDPTPRLRTDPEPAPPPARTPEPAPQQPPPSRRYWVSTPRESASPLVQLVRPSNEGGAPRYFINWENRPTYVNPVQPWYGGGWSYYPNWSWGNPSEYRYWY